MDDNKLTLDLDNSVKGLKPDLMSASVLMKIVSIVEAAIPEAADKSEENELPAVALIAIDEGSIQNLLQIGVWARTAAIVLLTAMQTGDYQHVPHRSHKKLLELSKLAQDRNLSLRFRGLADIDAEISAMKPVPQIRQTSVKSKTKIYGEVESVGGERPSAAIRLFSTGKQLSVSVNESLARDLGKKLYQFVGLTGTATVDLISGDYLNFEVEHILAYRGREADPSSAIERIEAMFPGRWDGINPEEFVNNLRDEGE